MIDTPTVEAMMRAYAEDGVDFAEAKFSKKLDYSENSVEQVEEILSALYDSVPKGFVSRMLRSGPTPEQIQSLSKALGGYVGEVMRRNWGGHWKLESAAFPGETVVTLELDNGGDVWPHFKAGKRLTNGPEDNIWHYFQYLKQKYQG